MWFLFPSPVSLHNQAEPVHLCNYRIPINGMQQKLDVGCRIYMFLSWIQPVQVLYLEKTRITAMCFQQRGKSPLDM